MSSFHKHRADTTPKKRKEIEKRRREKKMLRNCKRSDCFSGPLCELLQSQRFFYVVFLSFFFLSLPFLSTCNWQQYRRPRRRQPPQHSQSFSRCRSVLRRRPGMIFEIRYRTQVLWFSLQLFRPCTQQDDNIGAHWLHVDFHLSVFRWELDYLIIEFLGSTELLQDNSARVSLHTRSNQLNSLAFPTSNPSHFLSHDIQFPLSLAYLHWMLNLHLSRLDHRW